MRRGDAKAVIKDASDKGAAKFIGRRHDKDSQSERPISDATCGSREPRELG